MQNEDTQMQKFRVNIKLPRGRMELGRAEVADFLDMLANFGLPQIVSYSAGDEPTMVLEFTSHEDYMKFAKMAEEDDFPHLWC